MADKDADNLITIAEWSIATGKRVSGLNYLILKYALKPARIAGATRLFRRSDLDRVLGNSEGVVSK